MICIISQHLPNSTNCNKQIRTERELNKPKTMESRKKGNANVSLAWTILTDATIAAATTTWLGIALNLGNPKPKGSGGKGQLPGSGKGPGFKQLQQQYNPQNSHSPPGYGHQQQRQQQQSRQQQQHQKQQQFCHGQNSMPMFNQQPKLAQNPYYPNQPMPLSADTPTEAIGFSP